MFRVRNLVNTTTTVRSRKEPDGVQTQPPPAKCTSRAKRITVVLILCSIASILSLQAGVARQAHEPTPEAQMQPSSRAILMSTCSFLRLKRAFLLFLHFSLPYPPPLPPLSPLLFALFPDPPLLFSLFRRVVRMFTRTQN